MWSYNLLYAVLFFVLQLRHTTKSSLPAAMERDSTLIVDRHDECYERTPHIAQILENLEAANA